jgi:glycosyltransferase involved in cell wall biosynthesis
VVHIHALFSFASVAAAWAARRAKVPYVVRPLGLLNSYGMTQRRALLKRLSLRTIEGPLLRDAAAVHFTSLAEQSEAESLGWPIRSVVIPLGIELPPAASPEQFLTRYPELQGLRRILFLSRIDPKKNLEGLLRATGDVAREVADVALIVCGDGAPRYVARLQSLCAEPGTAGRVVWAGHVEGTMKQSALAAAELFVLPSFSENFGIAAVEALGAGLPAILGQGVAVAADVAAADAGLVVSPEPDSIAAAIRCLLLDGQRRRRAAANARGLAAEKFSTAAMASNLTRLYSRIACGVAG